MGTLTGITIPAQEFHRQMEFNVIPRIPNRKGDVSYIKELEVLIINYDKYI